MAKLSRRQILIGGSVVGGGLLLGFAFSGRSNQEIATDLVTEEGEALITTWIRIDSDNQITVLVPHCDMGQGILTALPMMAAEEMEADWSLVRVEQAPADPAFANGPLAKGYLTDGIIIPSALTGISNYGGLKVAQLMNLQITGGSTAIRFTGHYGMRMAGAAAKDVLVRAAAARWGVPASECSAKLSHVHHAASSRSATFGELAAEAALLDLPSNPQLKNKADYTIVGTPKPRFDIPAKVTGTAPYAIDMRLPGMLYAAIRPAPVFGGEVASLNADKAQSARGVHQIVTVPGAVAVVADNYWRAARALNLLEIEFSDGGNGDVTSDSLFAQFDRDLDADDATFDVDEGDTDGTLAQAARKVEAAYRVPFLAHATMEPMNCTARVADGKAEVWVGVQDALGTRARIADVLGISLDNVTLHPLLLGGGFGRRGTNTLDYVEQAVRIAAQVDAPVKLVWSRETDMQQDYYRPAVAARFAAALDETGRPTALRKRYIRKDEPAEAALVPYAIANQSIGYVESPTHVRYGPWRSVAHTQHTFFNESFIDELAHEAGADPYTYRRDLLADKPRHLAVLDLAAKKAGWGTPLPAGRARGIALQESFQSIVAEVAEISLDDQGQVRVHKVVCAVDCGTVINPQIARSQVESGVIYGLTAALYGEITIDKGRVMQSNFPDYEMVKLAQSPEIETYFIDSDAPLGGLGEPATPPIAAAVANAVYSLTGTRVRSLPLKNHNLMSRDKMAFAAD